MPYKKIDELPENKGWFEIFRTGTYTDSAGKTSDWTEKDLDEIISLYDPAKHEAPIVIGHPEHDSPAYGWIEALKREGDRLLAQPKQLIDDFKGWVKKGLYKKVSIALYPDLGLRHVGFLGAAPPAVKGLKQAAFGEQKAKWVIESELKFMEPWQQEAVKSLFQRIRDFIIEKFGLDEADKIISSYQLEDLNPRVPEEAVPAEPVPAVNPFNESNQKSNKGGNEMDKFKQFLDGLKALVMGAEKDIGSPGTPAPQDARFTEADLQAAEKRGHDALFAENEKLRKEKEESDRKVKETNDKAKKDEIAVFCETQCKESKLTPALRKIIEPVMVSVMDGGQIEFSEGVKKTPLEGIKDFLAELPKVVEFKEVSGDGTPGAPKSFEEAVSKVQADKKISKAKAIAFCAKEYPELHDEYVMELPPSKK